MVLLVPPQVINHRKKLAQHQHEIEMALSSISNSG